jgi:hypothetical protein
VFCEVVMWFSEHISALNYLVVIDWKEMEAIDSFILFLLCVSIDSC